MASDHRIEPPLPVIEAQSRMMQDWLDSESVEGTTVYKTKIKVTLYDGSPAAFKEIRVWVSPLLRLIHLRDMKILK